MEETHEALPRATEKLRTIFMTQCSSKCSALFWRTELELLYGMPIGPAQQCAPSSLSCLNQTATETQRALRQRLEACRSACSLLLGKESGDLNLNVLCSLVQKQPGRRNCLAQHPASLTLQCLSGDVQTHSHLQEGSHRHTTEAFAYLPSSETHRFCKGWGPSLHSQRLVCEQSAYVPITGSGKASH